MENGSSNQLIQSISRSREFSGIWHPLFSSVLQPFTLTIDPENTCHGGEVAAIPTVRP
jgi:hypothetical protein